LFKQQVHFIFTSYSCCRITGIPDNWRWVHWDIRYSIVYWLFFSLSCIKVLFKSRIYYRRKCSFYSN
jgi:hypothetical protein